MDIIDNFTSLPFWLKTILVLVSFFVIPPIFWAFSAYYVRKKTPNRFLNLTATAITIFIGLSVSIPWLIEQTAPETETKNTSTTLEQPIKQKENTFPSEKKEYDDPQEKLYDVVSITDGDTFRIMYEGSSTPLRMIAIDTPELHHPSEPVQCYAKEAKEYLESLIAGKKIHIESEPLDDDKDKYDRLLRYVFLEDGTNVNEKMLSEGYAFEKTYTPGYKYQTIFKDAQQEAIDNKKGLWAENTCKGDVYTGTYKDPSLQDVVKTAPTVPIVTKTIKEKTTTTKTNTGDPSFTCNCGKTCGQMDSCKEAYYQLNTCGCSARDGDHDGVPCESLCR